jgi:hypothetical protein
MDEFVNSLDISKFESTNSLWNELMLNDPWSVGFVSALIESKPFKNKEDWENYYYTSGEDRDSKLSKYNQNTVEKLNDELLILRRKYEILELNQSLKNLNFYHGRTKKQIEKKGNILYEEAVKRGIDISIQECIESVRFRTICQTWNGIIIREKKSIKLLKQKLPEYQFEKTDGDFDYKYAVDYQMKKNGILICGIQIKPGSYAKSKSINVQKAREANQRKNQKYTDIFTVPVFDIIFEKGEILNISVLDELKILSK